MGIINFCFVHMRSDCREAHLSGIDYFSVHVIVSTPPNIQPLGRHYVNMASSKYFFLAIKQTVPCITTLIVSV
jgi:hypothetical protein